MEAWRSDVEDQAGSLPVNFLLAWIQTESGSNPCDYTSLRESGIFQLMYGDNLNVAGSTEAQMHPVPPCVAGTRTIATRASLTDDQAHEQVRGGIQYVNWAKDKTHKELDDAGYDWSENDASFWQLVKMQHVAPARIPAILKAAGPVADWATWRQTAASYYPASWLDNAEKVGAYGEGGGSALGGSKNLLVIALLLGGAYYLWKSA